MLSSSVTRKNYIKYIYFLNIGDHFCIYKINMKLLFHWCWASGALLALQVHHELSSLAHTGVSEAALTMMRTLLKTSLRCTKLCC